MASTLTSKQRLALAICDFLSTSTEDGTLSADDKDSIDVAVNCIAESFKVDPTSQEAVKEAVGTQNLLKIYSVYEKLQSATKPAAAAAPAGASAGAASAAASKTPSEDDKKKAEELKGQGNRAMASKDYPTAIDFYTQALALHPGNAIFLSNRAAAYSAARDHESARADAEAAVVVDPKYTKAWSRLGLARFALGDAKGSMEAYKQGIEHEGNGGSDAMKKGFETAKKRVEELEQEDPDASAPSTRGGAGGAPDFSSLASMLGGGGGGGMPDLSSIMSNPMFAQMAQNMMSNPDMMSNLMSNPRLREMANQFGSGGGMPDIGALMSDPNIADMAKNFMGGAGGPGAGRGPGSPPPSS
ncbi:small glutamine-rich tetratricopeptide repeat-containing protein 2-like protein [Apiospora hydei]|uniref:Small glutamine-rich tetratricopeptide repeat-containing protein 2-like protein n=1 Tax=Apiospora hydei TaxID=1337664 RepID=A0ABR1WYI5_9PEZI